jgi:hypothetical protein
MFVYGPGSALAIFGYNLAILFFSLASSAGGNRNAGARTHTHTHTH